MHRSDGAVSGLADDDGAAAAPQRAIESGQRAQLAAGSLKREDNRLCCGVTAKDNRLFFNAVVWLIHTVMYWADLPEWFGKSTSACRCFRRLTQKACRHSC
ncbi:transposase [Hymenobacter glaciei]|uniref:transposase n=1 Tax=Hymenobacter glaciei TaxID=877209 RepID=UPI003CD0613C